MNLLSLLALLSVGAVAWGFTRGAQAAYQPAENLLPVYNPPEMPPADFQGSPNGFVGVEFPNAATLPVDTWNYPIAAATLPADTWDTWDMAPPSSGAMTVTDQEMKNLDAFLAIIRLTESTDDYNIIAGGGRFTSYAEHPFILNPKLPRPAGTTASGAYQIVVGTWKEARDALGLTDFSPASQDRAAMFLIERRGALIDVINGNFLIAIRKLQNEWEAFMKMLAGTYPITLADAAGEYQARGGIIA